MEASASSGVSPGSTPELQFLILKKRIMPVLVAAVRQPVPPTDGKERTHDGRL